MKEEDRLEWKQRAREWAILVPDRKRFFEILQEDGSSRQEDGSSRAETDEEEAGAEPIPSGTSKEEGSDEQRRDEVELPEIDPSPLEDQIRTEALRDRILYDAEDALIEGSEEEERVETGEGEEEKPREEASEETEEPTEQASGAGKSERSFMDWLDPEASAESGEKEERSEQELIQAFISEGEGTSGAGRKKQFFSSERMARNSSDESGLPVSETLAEIYVQQGDHKRAIQAFEQLRLNIPEKSDYFARRVQQIKERTKR
jgi:hypothetical protein